ncbi:MAG: Arp2/3 complex subunit, actin nucleation center [Paramarteilia canceri]
MTTNVSYVIDVGTSSLKCGVSTDNTPRVNVATMVGRQMLQTTSRSKNSSTKQYKLSKGMFVGNDALENKENLEISYPIVNGVVVDENNARIVFERAVTDELDIKNPEQNTIILTQAAGSPIKHTKFLLDYFLDELKFKVVIFLIVIFQGVYIAVQAYLTLVGSGYKTGLVLDSGAGVTHVVPYYESMILKGKRLDIAGAGITKRLLELLQKRGYSMNFSADYQIAEQIKQQFCFVAQSIKKEKKLTEETTYNDLRIKTSLGMMNLSDERFMAPEVLFDPSLVDMEVPGVGEMIWNCVQDQSVDLRQSLFKNMILSGGTTKLVGVRTRIGLEYTQLSARKFGYEVAQKQVPKIIDNPNREASVFIGAGMLANVASQTTANFWLTSEDYHELGSEKAIRKLLMTT